MAGNQQPPIEKEGKLIERKKKKTSLQSKGNKSSSTGKGSEDTSRGDKLSGSTSEGNRAVRRRGRGRGRRGGRGARVLLRRGTGGEGVRAEGSG